MIIGKYNNIIDFDGKIKFTGTPKSPYIIVNLVTDLPVDYSDVTSIDNFDLYSSYFLGTLVGFKDEKAIQREVKILANAKCSNDINANFGLLTLSEQAIVRKYNLSDLDNTNQNLNTTPIELNDLMDEYETRNTKSRGVDDRKGYTGRIKALRKYLFSKLQISDAKKVLKDASDDNLLEKYKGGIEGYADDQVYGLKDFFLGITGSPYDVNGAVKGLALRTYIPKDGSGDSMTIVANTCIGIMDGYY